jgi:Ca2+-binding EF-hand superfamily protein
MASRLHAVAVAEARALKTEIVRHALQAFSQMDSDHGGEVSQHELQSFYGDSPRIEQVRSLNHKIWRIYFILFYFEKILHVVQVFQN